MAEVNKINSFKSFTEIKAQGSALKLREENQTKRQELASNFTSILDEMGITSLTELDEETQRTFISKVLGKDLNEGNTFVYAASKAKAEGKSEFEFNGKTYKVTIKDTGVQESLVNEGKEMYKISIDTEVEDSKIGNKFYNVRKGEKVELVDDDGDIATVKLKSGEVVNIESKYVVESVVTEGLSKEQKMVETFLNKIAKEFDYSIQDAVRFVKETISKMGLDESVVNEASMSDIDQMAQDSKDFKSFVKEFTKKHHDLSSAGEPGQFMDWLQSIYDDAKENMDESIVTEGKDDYMARFGSANINLKKGYKHHTEDELNDLYDKLGDLVKTLNVKDVTLVFESELTEGAKEDALYRKQQLAKLKDAKEDSKSTKRLLTLQQKQNQARLKKANEAEELVITEAEIKSDDEFKEYAFTVLKNAFESDFDEAKAEEIVSGILAKVDGDYGAAVGMLTSSLGESVTNEATNIVKILRKLGWAGETWTPQELASQIKNLDNSTLIAWSKDNKGIPNTPLAFQMKLVDAEMEKRGLSESFTNEDIDAMITQES